MRFTAVVTAHATDPAKIITNLLTQSRRPDEILLYVSDPAKIILNLLTQTRRPDEILVYLSDPPEFTVADMWSYDGRYTYRCFVVPNRDDWGHEKRAMGLERATGDVIGWFNHDDEYEPTYVEELLDEIEHGADVAYCNWSQSCREGVGDAEFRMGSSTSGNWIARTSVVRAAGYRSRQYSADGLLIDDVREKAQVVSKVHKTLYHHNP